MAKTIEQQAVEAFVAAVDGVAGLTVYTDRQAAIESGDLPAANILVTGSTPEDFVGHGVDAHRLQLVVALYDKAAAGETITEQLSTLRGQVRQAIAADHTLGGLVVDTIETDCDVDAAELAGAPKAGAAAIAFDVLYWTRAGDPFTAGP